MKLSGGCLKLMGETDLTVKFIEGLSTSGPLGVAFYFVGREVLKAWAEDRKVIQNIMPQVISLLSRIIVVLEKLENNEHEKQNI